MIQKITPCLWFDDHAEEAVKTYASIFKNSKIGRVTRYEEESAKVSGRPAGTVMTVEFQLEGQDFVALNGGPIFTFNEAISFQVSCKTQEEVDHYWRRRHFLESRHWCVRLGGDIRDALSHADFCRRG